MARIEVSIDIEDITSEGLHIVRRDLHQHTWDYLNKVKLDSPTTNVTSNISALADQEELPENPQADLVDYVLDMMTEHDIQGWIIGFNEKRTHAMVAWETVCTIIPIHTKNGRGRWECSVDHYREHADLYRTRFPNTHTAHEPTRFPDFTDPQDITSVVSAGMLTDEEDEG